MASLRRPSVYMPSVKVSLPPSVNPRRDGPSTSEGKDGKRNARKSRVGDAIKKRLSMRYAGGDEVMGEAPPMPGKPSAFLTAGSYAPSRGRAMADVDVDDDEDSGETRFHQFASPDFGRNVFEPTDGQDEVIRRRGAADMTRDEEWDLEELGKDGFDLNDFMRRTLTGADEEEVKRFKAALMRQKDRNGADLQRNVFKHYAEFVTISKEISTLENDMLELKELLAQWKDLPQLMGMEDTLAPRLDKEGNLERRRTQRNSVADLQTMYKQQLTTLWATVEGSQKYLPLVPGRHLVFETHEFVELNAATYKAKQSVSMFLLNDVLLIAGRRRLKTANSDDRERDRGRMVAERSWVLADLVVVDVKDSGDLTNALKIRKGKEVCVYRTSRPEDKKALLAAFRQVSQELGEKKRKESEKEQVRRKTMWLGDGGGVSGTSPLAAHRTSGRPLSTVGTSVADSKDLRWIDEFGDDLTMKIAMRDWDESLKLVEKGNDLLKTVASNASAHGLLTTRLEELTPTLVQQVVHDLSSLELRKTSACRLIHLLVRLDRADLARDTFLKERRAVMLKRVRAIRAEGDISIYISELAIVCFTIIRHTSDWYMSAFKENKMASGFVTWAKDLVETFADLFRRQVYASTIGPGVAEECIKVTASHNRKLLQDVGLDFTFLLSTLLQPDPTSNQPHPMFQSHSAQTPGPGYHIEPSPFPSHFADTPAPDHMDPIPGSTAPLALKGRRRPSEGARSTTSREGTPRAQTPESRPMAPPRSARRVDSSHSGRVSSDSLR